MCNKDVPSNNYAAHMKGHTDFSHKGVCFDEKNGFYLIAKGTQGNRYPCHVQINSSSPNQISNCENDDCRNTKDTASRSHIAVCQCSHIQIAPKLPSK